VHAHDAIESGAQPERPPSVAASIAWLAST
jgi:hypothetical protein